MIMERWLVTSKEALAEVNLDSSLSLLEVPTILLIGFSGTLPGAQLSVVNGLLSTEMLVTRGTLTLKIYFLPLSRSLETITSAKYHATLHYALSHGDLARHAPCSSKCSFMRSSARGIFQTLVPWGG